MRRFIESNFLPMLLAVLLFLVTLTSGEQVRKWWSQWGRAIDWKGVEVITKTVRPGGTLSVVYLAEVNKHCPADLQSVIFAEDGAAAIVMPPARGGYSPVSDGQIRIKVDIPIPLRSDEGRPDLKSGPYVYRTTATRMCIDGTEYDGTIPDVHFQLEVP